MGRFNKEEFGNRIKMYRKAKGLSTDNLAMMINKSQSIVSRYESGDVLPDAETITMICDALDITENDFYNSNDKIDNKDMSINPFGVKALYLYYRAYNKKKDKFFRGKFKLIIREKDNKIVGSINFRWELTRSLDENFGGNIGYVIRPTERRKGYATQALRLGLELCREKGMKFVRVGCYTNNTGSRKTIIKNGGKLIDHKDVLIPEDYYEIKL